MRPLARFGTPCGASAFGNLSTPAVPGRSERQRPVPAQCREAGCRLRSDPRYAFASALRARSRRISFSISSMRSSCALISRSRSIRPDRIARFAAARLELGGVSSGNETNPRSQHVLERLPQRTLLRARTLIKFTADHRAFNCGLIAPPRGAEPCPEPPRLIGDAAAFHQHGVGPAS